MIHLSFKIEMGFKTFIAFNTIVSILLVSTQNFDFDEEQMVFDSKTIFPFSRILKSIGDICICMIITFVRQ